MSQPNAINNQGSKKGSLWTQMKVQGSTQGSAVNNPRRRMDQGENISQFSSLLNSNKVQSDVFKPSTPLTPVHVKVPPQTTVLTHAERQKLLLQQLQQLKQNNQLNQQKPIKTEFFSVISAPKFQQSQNQDLTNHVSRLVQPQRPLSASVASPSFMQQQQQQVKTPEHTNRISLVTGSTVGNNNYRDNRKGHVLQV